MSAKKKNANQSADITHARTAVGREASTIAHANQLAVLASMALEAVDDSGIAARPVEEFVLSPAQREVLIQTADISKSLQNKFNQDEPTITLEELVEITSFYAKKAANTNSWQHLAFLQVAEYLAARLVHDIGELSELDTELDSPRPSSDPNIVYQFKITLVGSEPPIWRRIQIEDCTLDDLHFDIQAAMGWDNDHLHQFKIQKQIYGDPALLNDTFGDAGHDSTSTWISQIVPKTKKRFQFKYEYDFGDSWMHQIDYEGSREKDPKTKYPICTEGARACPPEDVGGVYGYFQFLEAIADPEHEEHGHYVEWCEQFDQDKFDPADATKQMTQFLSDEPF